MYAGKDPLTGKQIYLKKTATTEERAHIELGRLLEKAAIGSQPESGATVGYLLDQYMEVAELDESTRGTYLGFIRRTIRPGLGDIQLRKLRGPILDRFYARLRRCGDLRCTGSPFVEHRYVPPAIDATDRRTTSRRLVEGLRADIASGLLSPREKLPSVKLLAQHLGIATDTVQKALRELRTDGLIVSKHGSGSFVSEQAPDLTTPSGSGRHPSPKARAHDCGVAGCRPHVCTPMGAGTIRQLHAILTGAFGAAQRWEWIDGNPAEAVRLPRVTRKPPEVPTPEDVASCSPCGSTGRPIASCKPNTACPIGGS